MMAEKRRSGEWARFSYAPVVDDEDYLQPSKIEAWRDEEHRKLFPGQYENGVRVRDHDGNPILVPKKPVSKRSIATGSRGKRVP